VSRTPAEARRVVSLTLGQVECGFLSGLRMSSPPTSGFEADVDLSLEPAVYDLINAAWDGSQAGTRGTLRRPSPKGTLETRFDSAFLTATGLPRLDSSNRAPASIALRVWARSLEQRPTTAELHVPVQEHQVRWRSCDFRVEIDGIDCSTVSSVASFTVKSSRSGGKSAFPRFEVSVATGPHSMSWSQWEKTAAEGGDAPRGGAIVYLAPDALTEHGRISLSGLRLLMLSTAKVSSDEIGHLVATLSCDHMALAVGG
jgi:hypothetical protein